MLETSDEGVSEVVKTLGLIRVAMRSEVNSIHERRNCGLEVTQLPEVVETSFEGVARGY